MEVKLYFFYPFIAAMNDKILIAHGHTIKEGDVMIIAKEHPQGCFRIRKIK